MPSAPMWFGFLRTIPQTNEVTERKLPGRTRLSKRAVHQLAAASVRAGWLEVRNGTGLRTTLGLSGPGRGAAASWVEMAGSTEQRWCDRVGANHTSLKETLGLVVGQLDLEWPHYPISYGSADPSVTGGRSRPGSPGPPRVPAHGQDWAPVVRGQADTVSVPTVTALLSQLLVAFSVDYAEAGGAALVVAEGLVRGFGPNDRAAVEDLPPVLGVKASGRSGLERHGILSVHRDPTDRQIMVAQLTALGARVRDEYARLVEGVESDWAERFGASTITALRGELEAMLAAFDPALPDALIATYVRS